MGGGSSQPSAVYKLQNKQGWSVGLRAKCIGGSNHGFQGRVNDVTNALCFHFTMPEDCDSVEIEDGFWHYGLARWNWDAHSTINPGSADQCFIAVDGGATDGVVNEFRRRMQFFTPAPTGLPPSLPPTPYWGDLTRNDTRQFIVLALDHPISYHSANDYCRTQLGQNGNAGRGSHLGSVDKENTGRRSQSQQIRLMQTMCREEATSSCWIGLRYNGATLFEWENEQLLTPDYENIPGEIDSETSWAGGTMPNFDGADMDVNDICVVMYADDNSYDWLIVSCTSATIASTTVRAAICENPYYFMNPTNAPTSKPTKQPLNLPATSPTPRPTAKPTSNPTDRPTKQPTDSPTGIPTKTPSSDPTDTPTQSPTGNNFYDMKHPAFGDCKSYCPRGSNSVNFGDAPLMPFLGVDEPATQYAVLFAFLVALLCFAANILGFRYYCKKQRKTTKYAPVAAESDLEESVVVQSEDEPLNAFE